MLKDIRKIAVLRANALGDFIVTLPAIKAIRDKFRDAEIVLLGRPWHRQFLVKGRSPIDRVIVVPVKKGIRNEAGQEENISETKQFFEEMQKEQFDLAIGFQGNGTSANPFLKGLGAKHTVGLWTEGAERLDKVVNYYYYQSETLRYLEVASLVGATPLGLEPELRVMQADRDEIRGLLKEFAGKPFIILHPVATDIRRMWPIENYPKLADALFEQGFDIVFSGSQEDGGVVGEIIRLMKHPAYNTCALVGLGGLTALLSEAALMISTDTGPLHLARAVNTPTVGIYWAPNLINWGPLSRNIHKPVVSWNMTCPYCGIIPNDPYPFEPHLSSCKHEVSFVRDVTVEAVIEAVTSLLNETRNNKEIHKEDTKTGL